MTNLFGGTPEECPAYGRGVSVPIIYGAPSSEMLMVSELGQMVLGGLEPDGAATQWRCQSAARHHAF